MNTHEKLKQIIILYDQGYSITKLKNMFHISDTTISKYLKENNRIVKNKEYYNNHINKLQSNNGKKECLTKVLCYSGRTSKKISNILYSNSKIHLDRKYKRYLFFHDLPC